MSLAVVMFLIRAVSPGDSAVLLAFQRADAGLAHFAVLQRTGVTEELDMVVAIGSPKAFPVEQTAWTWWNEDRKIGLFLQEKALSGRVYLLGTKAGFQDCAARVERVTSTDVVVSCQGEKSERRPNQKWVYDVRAKSLVAQFSYRPVPMYRGFPIADGAVFVGSDTERLVAIEYKIDREPAFRLLSEADAAPWLARVHTSVGTEGARRVIYFENENAAVPAAIPALPQTTYDQFALARPRRVKDGYVRAGTEIHDSVEPWQRDGGRIWFGKSFYDGEGSTGVGGFGYFDLSEHRLHMFAPAEIADWSVSAIDVGLDAVWMGLVGNGEYGGSSGGMLRYDRQSGAVTRIEFPDIAIRFVRVRGDILAATDFGVAVVEEGGVKRYFVDRTSDGRLRVAAGTR